MSLLKKVKKHLGISIKESANWQQNLIDSLSKEQLLLILEHIRYPEDLEVLASEKLLAMQVDKAVLLSILRSSSKNIRARASEKLFELELSPEDLKDILFASPKTPLGDRAIEKMLKLPDAKASFLISASLFTHKETLSKKIIKLLLLMELNIDDFTHIFKSYHYREKAYLPFLDAFLERFLQNTYDASNLSHILVFCHYQKVRDAVGHLLLKLDPNMDRLGYIVSYSSLEEDLLEASQILLDQKASDSLQLAAIVTKCPNTDFKIQAATLLLRRKRDSSVYRDIVCYCPSEALCWKAWEKFTQLKRPYSLDAEFISKNALDEGIRTEALNFYETL